MANVIFLEIDGFCQLPAISSVSPFNSMKHVFVRSRSAIDVILSNAASCNYFVSNAIDEKLFAKIKDKFPLCQTILFSDQPLTVLNKKNHKVGIFRHVDHIISPTLDKNWDLKVLENTLFSTEPSSESGLSRYFSTPNKNMNCNVAGNYLRAEAVHKVRDFCLEHEISSHLISTLCAAGEELLMNATFDAPLEAGVAEFQDARPTDRIELSKELQATLNCYISDSVVGVSVRDPFGALSSSSFYKYANKIAFDGPAEEIIDNKRSGAGLGLLKVLHGCQAVIANVQKGHSTEVMAFIKRDEKLRSLRQASRTIQFFQK